MDLAVERGLHCETRARWLVGSLARWLVGLVGLVDFREKRVTSPSTDTVLAALPAALFVYAQNLGITTTEFQMRGLPGEGFPDPDAFVPYEQCLTLWDMLIERAPVQACGVDFGKLLGTIDIGVVGLASAYAQTLGEAIEVFIRLQHVVDPSLVISMTYQDRLAVITFDADARLVCRRHPMEAMLVSSHRISERLVGASLDTESVCFAKPLCAPPVSYRAVFSTEPKMGVHYCLRYDAAVMDRPLPNARPELVPYLKNQAELTALRRTEASKTTSDEVNTWLLGQLLRFEATFEVGHEAQKRTSLEARAAKALGRSVRSLQRHLANEGTSFQVVLDTVLTTRAKELLGNNALAVFEVAFALGYQEPRAFQRAFKRWTGMTPKGFRESL